MPTLYHVDRNDVRVAPYRAVSDPALARQANVFVAEGRLVVARLVEDRRFNVESLLLNEAAFEALGRVLDILPSDTPVYLASADDFSSIAGFHVHRGCLALARRPREAGVADVVRFARRVVVMEEVANSDNVGGVFRNAAAFGVDAVILSPGASDPLYRKAIRTSMGAVLRVPYARAIEWPIALDALRSLGFTVVALTPRKTSIDLETVASMPRPARIALLLGTEGDGLSAGALARSDLHVHIPISPAVDSLNLAVAAGIVLARLSTEATLW
jgi:tRNA G18 (ribose-2'-O)-methylase SpoU